MCGCVYYGGWSFRIMIVPRQLCLNHQSAHNKLYRARHKDANDGPQFFSIYYYRLLLVAAALPPINPQTRDDNKIYKSRGRVCSCRGGGGGGVEAGTEERLLRIKMYATENIKDFMSFYHNPP